MAARQGLSYYDQMLAARGLLGPSPSNSYVRNRQTGGLMPEESGAIQQAAANLGRAPSVSYNPNYWYTAAGQAELKQRQADQLDKQIEGLSTELAKQSQTHPQGGGPLDPIVEGARPGMEGYGDDPQQVGAQVAGNVLRDLQAMKPLVNAGIVSGRDVNAIVRNTLESAGIDARDRHKASTAVNAVTRGIANGTFNESQTAGVIESLKKEYGEATLLTVPGYSNLVGKEQELTESRIQQITDFAKHHGIDQNVLRWDAETNKPALDPTAVQVERYKELKHEAEVANLDKVWSNKREDSIAKSQAVAAQTRILGSAINVAINQGQDPTPLYNQLKALQKQHFQINDTIAEGVRPESTTTVTSSKPLSKVTSSVQFGSMDEFKAALKTGSARNWEIVLVGGVPWQAHPDGKNP